ncbi:MAG: hypothetical protein ACJ79M_13835 [Myxococcales bacterium]
MKKIGMLLVVAAACGGSDETDTSGMIGNWSGNGSVSAGAQSNQGTASVGITADGKKLSVAGLCLTSSVLHATAESETTFTIANQACPLVASTSPSGCQAITLTWASGHGTIENNVLTIATTGTLSGCGQSIAATYNFNGRK